MADDDRRPSQAAGDVTRATQLPPHFPRVGRASSPSCTSRVRPRCSCVHGNTFDVVRAGRRPTAWTGLADFLAEQLFGRWDLVIHYDLARGLRCAAGSQRQAAAGDGRRSRTSGSATCAPLPRDPTKGARRARSAGPEERDGRSRQAAALRGDPDRSRRLRRAERRPPRSQRADAPGDAAQLGVEPVHQAPQHGVRADRPAAVEHRRAARRATRTSPRSRCRCPTRAERTAFLARAGQGDRQGRHDVLRLHASPSSAS